MCNIEACGLTDMGFVGPKYTWCNNWRLKKRAWKRLDRILVNDQWTQEYQYNLIKHLVRTGSDHIPLLMKSHNGDHQCIKYIRFLNFWTEQNGFMDLIQEI